MKKAKKSILVFALMIIPMILSGCSVNERALGRALMNNSKIERVENKTSLKLNLEHTRLNQEELNTFKLVNDVLKDLEVEIGQKTITNKAKDKVLSEMDFNVTFKGVEYPFKVFLDMDMSGNNVKMREVISLPESIREMANKELGEDVLKEYIDYDVMALMEEMDMEEEFKTSLNESKKINKTFYKEDGDLAKNFFKDFKPEVDFNLEKGNSNLNGESITTYKVRLNDENTKKLFAYFMDYMLNDDTMKTLVMESMKESMKAMKEIDPDYNIEEYEKEMKMGMEIMKEVIESIKLIGDRGLNLEYGVNRSGFIVSTKGDLNFNFDLKNIYPESKGSVNFNLIFNSENKNINSKDLKVEFPQLTKENSISFVELMNISGGGLDQPKSDQPTVKPVN